ncbi:DUF4058 family protein [Roseiflexus sp.]
MPGPLPGMDPCLERRDLWPDVHQRLITYSADALQPQPRIAIPLHPPDPDAVLDVQAVLERCYEHGAYSDLIDYRLDPEVALPADDVAWVDAHLR